MARRPRAARKAATAYRVSSGRLAVDGDIGGRDCLLRYKSGGRVLAVASIYRDVDNLKAELAMERNEKV